MRIRAEMDNNNSNLHNRVLKGNAIVNESILCFTCRQMPKQCLETPCCNSVLCGDCAKLLRFCPNCSFVFVSDLKVNVPLQKIIDSIAAYCDLCDQSNSHADSCPKKQISCPYLCGESVPIVDIEEHVKGCDHVEVNCPNSCGASIRKRDLEKHTTTECWIPCRFARHGCKFNGILPKLQEHYKNDSHLHLEMVLETVELQNAEIQKLQQSRTEPHCLVAMNHFRTLYGPRIRDAAKHATPKEFRFFALVMICLMFLPKFLAAMALAITPILLISAVNQNNPKKIVSFGTALLALLLKAIFPWFLCLMLAIASFGFSNSPRCHRRLSELVNTL